MDAGKLRHLITIEKSTFTVDSYGARSETWNEYLECWASKRALTGREAFSMAQFNASIDTVWNIRYVDGIKPDMRISLDGYYYDIASVIDNDGRKMSLTIYTQVYST